VHAAIVDNEAKTVVHFSLRVVSFPFQLRLAVREAKKYPELAKAHKPRSAWEWPKESPAEKETRSALIA
jgi:hypothetical protein